MKRLGVAVFAAFLAVGLLMALVGGTAAASPRGRLGGPEAKHYTRVALEHRFGNAYRHGYAKNISCDRRTKRMMKCRVRWVIGDVAFKGWTRPHIYLHKGWRWKVQYRVRQINEYCQATGGSNCVDTKSGTYRGGKV